MAPMSACRVCKSTNLYLFLPLGDHPAANAFVPEHRVHVRDRLYPLDCQVCLDCAVIEVADQLPPDFFDDYVYVPSASATMLSHFDAFAQQITDRLLTAGDALLVDIGCNDGLLLAAAAKRGARVLGIEPAKNIAELARSRGVEVDNDYFNPETASRVREEHGRAAVITTSNTFNHIDDLHGFMRGVDVLLDDRGTFIVEVPQAIELVEKNEFDTVYHEHLSTFSVTSLVALFGFFAMHVSDIEVLAVHGGSMRVFGRRDGAGGPEPAPVVQQWLDREQAAGLFEQATYDALAERVRDIRERLMTTLRDLKADGKTIAGYGAPAKGTTLLNYYGIGPDLLEFLADRNELKHRTYSPGTRIPVVPAERVLETQPDYLLILAWNFADEIIEQQDEYRRRGGKFIVPIPEPRLIA